MTLRLLALSTAFLLSGCAEMKVAEFESGRPLLDPAQFFSGRTSSFGVMENRGGAPTKRVTTQTSGNWEGETLHLEQ
ncbi:MAG: DUF3833 family protein, partial [Chthoniobacterales bacterium]